MTAECGGQESLLSSRGPLQSLDLLFWADADH